MERTGSFFGYLLLQFNFFNANLHNLISILHLRGLVYTLRPPTLTLHIIYQSPHMRFENCNNPKNTQWFSHTQNMQKLMDRLTVDAVFRWKEKAHLLLHEVWVRKMRQRLVEEETMVRKRRRKEEMRLTWLTLYPGMSSGIITFYSSMTFYFHFYPSGQWGIVVTWAVRQLGGIHQHLVNTDVVTL